MKSKVLFLGTGASTGIPQIGCSCKVCSSGYFKNKRLRPSILIELKKKNLLIDVSVDFRLQALMYKIQNIDTLLITHSHYDHIGGIDDLRAFCRKNKKKILCILSKHALKDIRIRFPYMFEESFFKNVQLDFKIVKKNIIFEGIKIKTFDYCQGNFKVIGYRIADFAYIVDIKEYDEKIFDFLKGVNTLVLSALKEKKSDMHFNVKEAILFSKKLRVKKTYLTHIAHEIDHKKLSKKLPKDVFLAYDGLKLEFDH